jgi:hypothetical protein
MTLDEFKKTIARSIIKNTIVGSGIFLFGVFIAWLILSGADPEPMSVGGLIVLWVLAVICLFVGFCIVFFPVKAAADVRKGRHEVVRAIQQGDSSYVLWFYEYITQVKNGGSDHQVWIFGKDGRRFTIATNAKKAKEILEYLHQQFPPALYGYSKEFELLYEQKLEVTKRLAGNK